MDGHESRDVDIKSIMIWGAVFFGVTLFAFLALRPVYRWLSEASRPALMAITPVAEVQAPPPDPHITEVKAASGLQLREARRAEAKILESYRWLNRENGTVSVPIDRAIELLLARGLPARAATSSTASEGEEPYGESNGWSAGGVP